MTLRGRAERFQRQIVGSSLSRVICLCHYDARVWRGSRIALLTVRAYRQAHCDGQQSRQDDKQASEMKCRAVLAVAQLEGGLNAPVEGSRLILPLYIWSKMSRVESNARRSWRSSDAALYGY